MAIKLQEKGGAIDLTQKMFKGDDGGYYIPSVDKEGNLTWTPSEEDMEAVAGSNIQGLPGKDGQPGKDGKPGKDGQPGQDGKDTVWLGDEEPSADYNVWIAPGGTPTYVMTAEECQAYIDAALKEVEDGSY